MTTPNEAPRLSESEIRPSALMDEQARLFAEDVAGLVARRSEFVDVHCPACDASKPEPAWSKHTMAYVRCRDCETVYISPRPPPAVLENYYATSKNYEYWGRVIFPASEAARRDKVFRPRVQQLEKICERHGGRGGTLMEVGAGFGTFGEEIVRSGFFGRYLAVEPTPGLAAKCRARGLDVIEKPIEHAELDDQSADVIASFEVIEHLFDPGHFVAACARRLRPGGLLVLTCPNVRGFDIEILGPDSPAVDPEHLNYFHPQSLARLLESRGFSVLESQTPGRLDADIVRNRVLASGRALPDPFLQRVLIDDWARHGEAFQDFLVAQGLSSNMWIVAKRGGSSL